MYYYNNILEYFLEKESKKSKNKSKMEMYPWLLWCKSVTPQCKIIHNRDKNEFQNILNIVENIFLTGKRSNLFCRAVNS